MNKNIELKFINKHIVPNKQERYSNFIVEPKNRKKFIQRLAHFADLNFKNFIEVEKNEEVVIKEKLKAFDHITDCYIISENEEIDGKRLKTNDALSSIIGNNYGTIIIFGDAEIVYYEGEGMKNRWISK